MEPEHYLEVLDHLKNCAQRIIPKHGGTIVEFRGDGFLAMFGFPESSEDDGRRATEAALELHEAIRHVPFQLHSPFLRSLRMHSGIHSGLVLLIEGDPVSGGFALIGEAPSVAARLSDAAARDEVLVSATTLGAESHFFQIRERGHLSLQGKDEPVAAYQVLGRSPVHTRFEARTQRGLTPFVGRTHALDVLERALYDVITGRCLRTVSVVAPPGLGKTRLVEEFLRRAAAVNGQVYRGYCENYLGAEPLQPFLQMLRTLCKLDRGMLTALSTEALENGLADLDPDLLEFRAELLRALSASLMTRGSNEPRRQAKDDASLALRDLVSVLAQRTPVVLFIDDWQWVDDATRQVLGAIRELTARPILILTASRALTPRDADLSHTEVLEITPLDDDEAAKTIRALRPNADPFVVKQIQQLSGGNPLFIEELCHSAFKDGVDRHTDRGDSGTAWLSTLIESRVARLPPHQAELVRTAAVIGIVIPSWLLEQISGYGEQHAIVRELAEKDLIFPGESEGTLRFKHGITRDVVYYSVGLRQREEMHLRIAEFLEQRSALGGHEELFETLAYHYGAGAEPTRAAYYAERAGDKAMAASALDRARTQYGAALDALDVLEPSESTYRRWSSIAQRLGLACVYDPMRNQLGVFLRAVQLAGAREDEAAMGRAEYWLGYINYALGELSLAIHHCERARDHCRRAVDAARRACDDALVVELESFAVQVLATLGQAHAAACEHDRALAQLDEAIEIKRRHRSGARPAVGSAYTLACKGAVLGDRGRFADAHECFTEALDAVGGGNHAVKGSILEWQSAVYLWQGRWSDALASATRAQSIAERIASLYVLGMSYALAGYARWMLDRVPESIEAIIRATSWLEARDKRLSISLNYGWLADAMVDTNRYGEAREYMARALRRARNRDHFGVAMACRAMSRVPAGDDRHRPPEHYLKLAMASAHARGSPHEQAVTRLHQAQFEATNGRPVEAAALLERARSEFRAMDMHWHEAEAQRLSSRL